jgi:hypothetical protein
VPPGLVSHHAPSPIGRPLVTQVKEEMENMQNDEKVPEMEEVSERIHKRFTLKETEGSR